MIIHRSVGASLKSIRIPTKKHIQKAVRAVLSSEKVKIKGELNVIFVDNRMIRRVNKEFLGKNKPTDVIAFPYPHNRRIPDAPFGDVYISVTTAKQSAKQFHQSLHRELTRLVVHGVLHLLGYRDYKPQEKKRMWSRQEKIVQKLCPGNR